MSKVNKESKEKSKAPLLEIVIALVSFYFLYQSYSQISIQEYFSGIFFLVAGIVLLITTYLTYKNNKKEQK